LVERKFLCDTTNQKHYQDLGSARHQYGISALVTQTSFYEGSSGDLAKRRLFTQATEVQLFIFFKHTIVNIGMRPGEGNVKESFLVTLNSS